MLSFRRRCIQNRFRNTSVSLYHALTSVALSSPKSNNVRIGSCCWNLILFEERLQPLSLLHHLLDRARGPRVVGVDFEGLDSRPRAANALQVAWKGALRSLERGVDDIVLLLEDVAREPPRDDVDVDVWDGLACGCSDKRSSTRQP